MINSGKASMSSENRFWFKEIFFFRAESVCDVKAHLSCLEGIQDDVTVKLLQLSSRYKLTLFVKR